VQRLPAFRWESSLRTWLAGITVNVCRDILRRRIRERERLETRFPAAAGPTARPDAGTLDVERAIAGLPEGYREILVLHEIEGYTHEEIAGLLGIDAGTSKSQLSRARQALRSRLRGDPDADGRREGSS
jgi:RNA polymerase sigma-70 factor (ECF subfamily)